MNPTRTEGWIFLDNASKRHYFRYKRALCGRWVYMGAAFDEEPPGDRDSSACALCRRKLASEIRRKLAEKKEE